MKRILTVLVALILVLSCFAACDKGSDAEAESSRPFTTQPANQLEYTLNSDGNGYTVTGIGTYTSTDLIIDTYNGLPITEIGFEAFKGTGITSVTLGDSVTKVANQAFSGCRSLKSITIGTGITNMGYFSFDGCAALTDVYYNGTIESWCNISFGDAGNPMWLNAKFNLKNASGGYDVITKLAIPETVTEIKDYAFEGFDSLTSIAIPDTVMSIGKSAFKGCAGITSIAIPTSVTEISVHAFKGCEKLESATFLNTENWVRGRSGNTISIQSSELQKPKTAAEYLTKTFVEDSWQVKK
ncbi:MAG: leucine-rich repeat domain-containing protein [Ruminococcaceae bacterium]|nr:leucine-rich repeat domain-containing protein [Oscillospiraceae bacterium]